MKTLTALLLSIIACFMLPAAAHSSKRLWVLGHTGEITEYDPSTWAVLKKISVPVETVRNPEVLTMNKNGQMLFCPNSDRIFASLPEDTPASKLWIWDGQKSIYLDHEDIPESILEGSGNASAAQVARRYSLSGDGRNLYGFENAFQILKDAYAAELSVSTSIRAWQSDLEGRQRIRGNHGYHCAGQDSHKGKCIRCL